MRGWLVLMGAGCSDPIRAEVWDGSCAFDAGAVHVGIDATAAADGFGFPVPVWSEYGRYRSEDEAPLYTGPTGRPSGALEWDLTDGAILSVDVDDMGAESLAGSCRLRLLETVFTPAGAPPEAGLEDVDCLLESFFSLTWTCGSPASSFGDAETTVEAEFVGAFSAEPGPWRSEADWVAPPGSWVPFRSVSVGSTAGCGASVAGDLVCWGELHSVVADDIDQVAVVDNLNMGLALAADGSLQGVGVAPAPPEGSFVAIDAGASIVCALDVDGAVVCVTLQGAPEIPADPTAVDLAVSDREICILTDGGVVWCQGPYDLAPQEIGGSYVDVAVEELNHCALRADGGLDCWPDAVSLPSNIDGHVARVSVSETDVCVVSDAGELWCTGPTTAPLGALDGRYVDVDLTAAGVCALTDEDRVDCFGGAPRAP